MNIRIYTTFILITVLFGCNSIGPKYPMIPRVDIPEGKVVVYIYKPSTFLGFLSNYDLFNDDTKICTLYSGGFYCKIFEATKLNLWSPTNGKKPFSIYLKPNQIYYIRSVIDNPQHRAGYPPLELVPTDIAIKELSNCSLIENN